MLISLKKKVPVTVSSAKIEIDEQSKIVKESHTDISFFAISNSLTFSYFSIEIHYYYIIKPLLVYYFFAANGAKKRSNRSNFNIL